MAYYYDVNRGILIDKDNTNVKIRVYPPFNGKYRIRDYTYAFIDSKEVVNNPVEPPMNPLVFYDRLVTDGKAYINLGRKASKVMSIRLKYTPVGSGEQYIIGAKEANSSWHLFGTNGGTFSILWGSNSSSGQMSYLSQNEFDILISTTESNVTYRRFEGVYPDYSVTFGKREELFNHDLYIFCANDGGTPNYRCSSGTSIRSMVITDNSQISMMLYPCTFMGEAGLYDIINGVFYGNANSEGKFEVEGEGREYVLFDKLITDGNAYINTGVHTKTNDCELEAIGTITSNDWCSFYGNRLDGKESDSIDWRATWDSIWNGSFNGVGIIYQKDVGTSKFHEFQYLFKRDGDSLSELVHDNDSDFDIVNTTITTKTMNIVDAPITIFGVINNGSFGAKAGRGAYVKLFRLRDGKDSIELRPAWYEGQFGMWDMVRGAFYPNANSVGQFSVE